jgi:hypothetical protein
MRRYLSALLLGAMLSAPLALTAKDRDHDRRYYDPYRRDYHEWNENENRAWRHWREQERHRNYIEWQRANRREQREYWRWRHEHPDWDRR